MADETKIIRIIVDSSKAVDGSAAATRALEKLERSTASMDGALGRMERGLSSLGGAVKAQLALMVAELGARFIQMGKDSLNAVAGLDELAEQLGVTTKFLQASQFAAVQSGVKLEQLEAGYSKFSQKMGEAAEGSKEMVEALDKLGVKNLDVAGKLRPTEVLMSDVARAIVGIEDPARRSAAAVDFFGKAGARMLPMLKDIANGSDSMAERAKAAGTMISEELIAKLDKMADRAEVSSLRARALFAQLGAPIVTAALDAVNKVLESIADNLARLQRQAQTAPGRAAAADASNLNDQLDAARQAVARNPRDKMAASSLAALERRSADANATANAQQAADAAALFYGDTPKYTAPAAPGAKLSAIKGGGGGEGDRIAKLLRDTSREGAAAADYAAASERGARAVADLELHFKALKAAQDAYGNTADKNTGQVAALTAKIEEQMRAAERLKSLKDFNLGTEDLERANELLAAENALVNANVETRARELALIKLKHEVQAKGLDETNPKEKEAIDRRGEAITQNERLKAQGDELKKANELWTAPLKSALESIQQTGADAFEQMLTSGNFTFQSLGDTFKKIVIRMAAEFMALATIRPVMSVILNTVSPGMASSMGVGGGGGGFGGGAGMGGGGMGGLSMPSFGGAGISDMWASATGGNGFSGLFQGAVPTQAGVMGPQMPGALNAGSGLQMGSFGMGNAMGAVGIGMGALSLATNKKPTTASTIGGIGQMVGGALMMIPTPWTMAAGAVISLASSILPGLFGGGEQAPPYPATVYGGGVINGYNPARGFNASGSGANGGSSLAPMMSGLGKNLHGLYMAAAGGAGGIDANMIWGGALGTGTNDRNNSQKPYINLDLFGPNGSQRRVLDGDPSRTPEQGGDLLTRMAFYESLQGGGLPGASPYLLTAHRNAPPESVQELAKLIETVNAFTKAYDNLGKSTVSAKDALEALNNSFADMSSFAASVGASLAPINAELSKQRTRYAQDFIDNMLDPMAVQMRALEDQRKDSLASAEYIRDNVKDVYVDMARIAEYWTKKERDLKEEAYSASVNSLQALIQRLTYGDLANASPDLSLTGTRANYSATLAQARAGSSTAINGLAGSAESYATSARSYFASSAEYATIVEQIRRDLEAQVGVLSGGGIGGGAANGNEATNAVLQSNAELRGMVGALLGELSGVKDQLAAATAEMKRRA